MNRFDMIDLLKDLPDDIIESANRPHQRHFQYKKKIRYIVPTITACFVGLLCLTIYPILKTSAPESMLIVPASSSLDSTPDTDTTESSHEVLFPEVIGTSVNDVTITTAYITDLTMSSTQTEISEYVSNNHITGTSTASTVLSEIVSSDEPPSVTVASLSSTNLTACGTANISETKTIIMITEASKTETEATHKTTKTSITKFETTNEITSTTGKTVSFAIEKNICSVPEPPSGLSVDPLTGLSISFDARIDYDGEKWIVVLAEPCEDACIVSGIMTDHVLHLSIACLSAQGEYNEETVCFSLHFFDTVNIADIHVERQNFGDSAEFYKIYTDSPVILNVS